MSWTSMFKAHLNILVYDMINLLYYEYWTEYLYVYKMMIVKDRRVVHRVTSNDNEWQRMTTSGTKNGIEWYNEWQRVVQQVATSDKTNEYEWE